MGASNTLLGVDVGATSLKGALVHVEDGSLTSEVISLPTPNPSTPAAMALTMQEMVRRLNYQGPAIGCGFPTIMKKGVAWSAANIDASWIGVSVEKTFSDATGIPVYALNDADAAGLASVQFGSGKGEMGVVIFLTIGSGIGSALFIDGRLVPNTELGHFIIGNDIAERYVSAWARERNNLTWEQWGPRLNDYLLHLERLFSPDLFLLGGGGSLYYEEYKHHIRVQTPVIPDVLGNTAGIIGAAGYAASFQKG